MEIQREALVQTCEELKEKGFSYLKKITAVDYRTYFEVVYVLYNMESKEQLLLGVKLSNDDTAVPSVMAVFQVADWYERELAEMFGIRVTGRGNLGRLLLEEWNGTDFPLLKSFEWGKDYKRSEK